MIFFLTFMNVVLTCSSLRLLKKELNNKEYSMITSVSLSQGFSEVCVVS